MSASTGPALRSAWANVFAWLSLGLLFDQPLLLTASAVAADLGERWSGESWSGESWNDHQAKALLHSAAAVSTASSSSP